MLSLIGSGVRDMMVDICRVSRNGVVFGEELSGLWGRGVAGVGGGRDEAEEEVYGGGRGGEGSGGSRVGGRVGAE